jgi:hypothetical protein
MRRAENILPAFQLSDNPNLKLTVMRRIVKNYSMKKIAITLLLIAFCSMVSPLTLTVSPYDEGAYLISLDVCNASGHAAMSAGADSPAIQETCCSPLPLVFSGYLEAVDHTYKPALLTFSQERPPQL